MRPLFTLSLLALSGLALVACDDTNDSIGSSCRFDDDCADNQSCSGGFCVDDNPCVCPAVYEPVCGANGRTYGNACEAGCAGVTVASEGRCPGPDGGQRDGGAIDLGLLDQGADGGDTDGGDTDGGDTDGGDTDGGDTDHGADLSIDPDATADMAEPDAGDDMSLNVDGAATPDATPADDASADM